ncbi:MAG: hypothetical protein P8Y85_08380 [Nitrospirota bacterium]|jgi:hypothetical protein
MLRGTILAVSMVLAVFTLTGTAAVAEAGDKGMTMVAVGGGSLDEAMFINNSGDATFSFFCGYDKRGNLKGNFFAKRLIPDAGFVSVKSTEITDIQVGTDAIGPWVMVTGLADFMPTWSNQHHPSHRFTLIAWDIDGYDEGVDMIWFQVQRPYPDDYVRPAISLLEEWEVAGGNIMIMPNALE